MAFTFLAPMLRGRGFSGKNAASRQAPRRSEVRTRDPDSGDAGRTRHPARDAQGDLCVRADIRININRVRRDRVRWHSYAGNCHEHSNASGGVATLDGGSTTIPRRKRSTTSSTIRGPISWSTSRIGNFKDWSRPHVAMFSNVNEVTSPEMVSVSLAKGTEQDKEVRAERVRGQDTGMP